MSQRRRSRQYARRPATTKAVPPSTTRGNTGVTPAGYAIGDLVNRLTGQQPGPSGPFNPLPRDPANVSPFGPLNPLIPAALDASRRDTGRPEPRISEYPVAWNIPGNDQRLIPWTVLRGAANYIDIVRRCIEVRKRHIRSLKWVWTVSADTIQEAYRKDYRRGRDDIEMELRNKFYPEIARLTDFWCKPWRSNGLGFGQWINAFLEEHLVIDAVPIYPRMTYGGDVLDLEIVDGTTIKPLLDWRGARPLPPHPAFQQIVWGFPRGEFKAATEIDEDGNTVLPGAYAADQLYYHRENVRAGYPGYGMSAVEQALISARLYLKRQGWMLAEYDDGSTPLTWLEPDANAVVAGEDWNPRQRREWENSLNDELAGQTAARHRIKVTPPGFKANMMPSVDERYKPDYDLHLLKLLATHFNVTLPELGFTEAKGLGSQGYHEGQEDVQDRIGRRPDVAILAGVIMDVSQRFMKAPPELEFQFLGLESEDEAAQDQVGQNRVQSARVVLNEDRKRTGMPLYDFPEADMPMVITQRGVVFLEGASQLVPPGVTLVPEQVPDIIGGGQGQPGAAGAATPPARPAPATTTKAKKPKVKPQTQPGADGIVPADQLDADTRTQRGMVDRIITQLEPDYPDWSLDWIRTARWEGPTAVPLDQVDFTGVSSWQAAHEPDRVARFADLIRRGKLKPAIAVRNPGSDTLQIIDGHHRALAYRSLDQPVMTWIGTVDKPTGPWDEMHASQYRVPSIAGDEPRASEAAGGGEGDPDTANAEPTAAAKAAELAAYKRWTRKNPNPARPFVFQYNAEVDLGPAMYQAAARDWIVKADQPPPDGGGGQDPKVPPPPDSRWPGWALDLQVATYWAGRLRRALTAALGIDALVRLVLAAFPALRRGDVHRPDATWLAAQGIDLTGPIGQQMQDLLTEGYLVGERSAAAVMAGSLNVDWSAWKPGDPDAARQLLSADGADVGLRTLLDDAGITISSIADGRLDEVAAVLADGLEQGRTPQDMATALTGILDDPKWAEMVALTETSRASSAAAMARYARNEIPATRWLTAHDQNVCPICQANAAAGPVLLGQPFPSGDRYPPAHPRCRCAPVPVLERSLP